MSRSRDFANVASSLSDGTVAGKNKIINGDFSIWQRGTSFSNPSDSAYLADRWIIVYNGTGATRTVTRETFTPGSAPVAGYEGQYFLRYNQSVAGSGSTFNTIGQRIEDVRSLAGKIVTLSFWAKASANVSLPFVNVVQRFGFGGSAETIPLSTNATNLTTSWQRFSYTFSMPSVSGKTIGANSYTLVEFYTPLNAISTIDLWGVQLEAGSFATPFSLAGGGNSQLESLLCYRYYYKLFTYGTDSDMQLALQRWATTGGAINIHMPTPMRVTPSVIAQSATSSYGRIVGYDTSFGISVVSVTGFSVNATPNLQSIDIAITHASLSGSYVYASYDNLGNAAGLALSAEL